MEDPEARFRAWLRSIDRVFLPPRTQIMASAREMGLTPGRTQQILDSGQVPKGRVAFRLRLWSQAEIDLGFLHLNHRSFGAFFLGMPLTRGPDSYAVWSLPTRRRLLRGDRAGTAPPSDPCAPIRRRGGGKLAPPLPSKNNNKKNNKKSKKNINDK